MGLSVCTLDPDPWVSVACSMFIIGWRHAFDGVSGLLLLLICKTQQYIYTHTVYTIRYIRIYNYICA